MPASAEIQGAKGADAFILRMASGDKIRDAAKAAGVSESTAHQRLKFDTWQAAIAGKRALLFEEAEAKLAGTLTAAIETLADLLSSEQENVRYSAASAILKMALTYKERGAPQRLEIQTAPAEKPNFSMLTDEELRQVSAIFEKMQANHNQSVNGSA